MTLAVVIVAILATAIGAGIWALRGESERRRDRLHNIVAVSLAALAFVSIIDARRTMDTYIAATKPRDTAQEKCIQDTLVVLRYWLGLRLSGLSADEALRRVADESPLPDCKLG